MDQVYKVARQHLQAAKLYLDRQGEPYAHQRIYRVAMKLLGDKLWCGTQQEYELRRDAIRLIDRRWTEYRSRTGEAIDDVPLRWPPAGVVAGAVPLMARSAAPKPVLWPVYPDSGDGAAQLLAALDIASEQGLDGYTREARAEQELRRGEALYTDLCCRWDLAEETRLWVWRERQKRRQARALLADLRRGRVTEQGLRAGIRRSGPA